MAIDELDDLTRARIEGIDVVRKPPPTGWRDRVAVTATALGIVVSSVIGVALHPAGLLVGPLVGLLGYTKQFWKPVLVRKPRLPMVPAPSKPAGQLVELVGIAETFERTVEAPHTGQSALVAALEVRASSDYAKVSSELALRAIDAVPFWLATDGRRVLITGTCWLDVAPSWSRIKSVMVSGLRPTLARLGLKGVHRRLPKRSLVAEAIVRVGDRIAVTGDAVREEIAGVGGYRDEPCETMRGSPGAILWIEKRAP